MWCAPGQSCTRPRHCRTPRSPGGCVSHARRGRRGDNGSARSVCKGLRRDRGRFACGVFPDAGSRGQGDGVRAAGRAGVPRARRSGSGPALVRRRSGAGQALSGRWRRSRSGSSRPSRRSRSGDGCARSRSVGGAIARGASRAAGHELTPSRVRSAFGPATPRPCAGRRPRDLSPLASEGDCCAESRIVYREGFNFGRGAGDKVGEDVAGWRFDRDPDAQLAQQGDAVVPAHGLGERLRGGQCEATATSRSLTSRAPARPACA